MATIVPATTYPNGSVINVTDHNENIYSTTSGRGVVSEPNGGLGVVNLDASFAIKDEHVMPEEATLARMDGTIIPMDVYNNAFGAREDEDATYVPVAGLSERVFLPFDMSAVVWQWSFFVAGWIPYLLEVKSGKWDTGDAQLRLFIDGAEYPAFRRKLPLSGDVITDWSGDPPNTDYDLRASGARINNEQIATLWYDIAKLQKNVSRGFHELSIKLYLPRLIFEAAGDSEELSVTASTADFSDNGAEDKNVRATVHQRVTFGTRSVRCVAFK